MTGLFPPEGEGFVCDVQHDEVHLRLFSAMNSGKGGWTASVFDVNAKRWISRDQWADDAEDGKRKAQEAARLCLEGAPLQFDWKKTPGW